MILIYLLSWHGVLLCRHVTLLCRHITLLCRHIMLLWRHIMLLCRHVTLICRHITLLCHLPQRVNIQWSLFDVLHLYRVGDVTLFDILHLYRVGGVTLFDVYIYIVSVVWHYLTSYIYNCVGGVTLFDVLHLQLCRWLFETFLKSYRKIVERGKMDSPNTQTRLRNGGKDEFLASLSNRLVPSHINSIFTVNTLILYLSCNTICQKKMLFDLIIKKR
jgi:hypothetical protein